MSLLSVWTNEDTSEAGPSCDEREALVTVDDDRVDLPDTAYPLTLHIAADGPDGLWTVALHLNREDVEHIINGLQSAYGAVFGPPRWYFEGVVEFEGTAM